MPRMAYIPMRDDGWCDIQVNYQGAPEASGIKTSTKGSSCGTLCGCVSAGGITDRLLDPERLAFKRQWTKNNV